VCVGVETKAANHRQNYAADITVQQIEHPDQTGKRGQAFDRFKDRDGAEGAARIFGG
jgi:hypothetical protein